jgi:hypothetical protein
MKAKVLSTIPNYTYEPTADKNIFRFVDRAGDWTHYWIKNKRMFVPAVNHIIRVGFPKGERFYDYLLHTSPDEARRRLSTSGEEGSRTHEAIRDLIRGERITVDTKYFNELTDRYEPLSRDEWANIEAFYEWCMIYDPRVALVEHAVWSEIHRFAGTIDFIGTINVPDGDKHFSKEQWGKEILIILDWKTSSGIWEEYELQVASYRIAVIERMSQRLPISAYGGLWTGIVRLGTNHKLGFELKVWDPENSQKNFDIFCAAEKIYRRKEGEDFIPDIYNMPREFAIHIASMLVKSDTSKNKSKNNKKKEVKEKSNKKLKNSLQNTVQNQSDEQLAHFDNKK